MTFERIYLPGVVPQMRSLDEVKVLISVDFLIQKPVEREREKEREVLGIPDEVKDRSSLCYPGSLSMSLKILQNELFKM